MGKAVTYVSISGMTRHAKLGGVAFLLIASVTLCAIRGRASEAVRPEVLLNGEIDEAQHAIIVDKSKQMAEVWKSGGGAPEKVASFRCSTGEKEGDKQTEGDMRTPEGIYFFGKRIDGRRLAPKYGVCAFITDYPNPMDKHEGKTGYGIWLHGRNKPLDDKPDSNGCVSLANKDVTKLSHYIQLRRTPLIIVRKLIMTPEREALRRERKIREFLHDWIRDVSACDFTRCVSRYSLNFRSGPYRYDTWKIHMRRLFRAGIKPVIPTGPIHVYAYDNTAAAVMPFGDENASQSGKTVKKLFLTMKETPLILAEEYRGPVGVPRAGEPVLASATAETPQVEREPEDLQIRLLGIDDPDLTVESVTRSSDPPKKKKKKDDWFWATP